MSSGGSPQSKANAGEVRKGVQSFIPIDRLVQQRLKAERAIACVRECESCERVRDRTLSYVIGSFGSERWTSHEIDHDQVTTLNGFKQFRFAVKI